MWVDSSDNLNKKKNRHKRTDKISHVFQRRMIKTKICKWVLLGNCERGDECFFAHSEDEKRDLPNLLLTRICSRLVESGFCPDDLDCKFAHNYTELRDINDPLPPSVVVNIDNYAITPRFFREALKIKNLSFSTYKSQKNVNKSDSSVLHAKDEMSKNNLDHHSKNYCLNNLFNHSASNKQESTSNLISNRLSKDTDNVSQNSLKRSCKSVSNRDWSDFSFSNLDFNEKLSDNRIEKLLNYDLINLKPNSTLNISKSTVTSSNCKSFQNSNFDSKNLGIIDKSNDIHAFSSNDATLIQLLNDLINPLCMDKMKSFDVNQNPNLFCNNLSSNETISLQESKKYDSNSSSSNNTQSKNSNFVKLINVINDLF